MLDLLSYTPIALFEGIHMLIIKGYMMLIFSRTIYIDFPAAGMGNSR